MKILHIVNGNDFGGATTQVCALIKAQLELADVQVMAIGTGKIVDWCQAEGVQVGVIYMGPFSINGIRREIINRNRAGWVIHVHGLKPMILAGICAKHRGFESTVTIHSNHHLEYKSPLMRRLVALTLYKWSLQRITRFVVVSEGFRSLLKEEGISAEKVAYIPNGVDLDRIDVKESRIEFLRQRGLTVTEDTVIFGIAARLHPVKGIDMLIDACKALKGKPALVLIAGGGDDTLKRQYQAQIDGLNLSDQVKLIGYVENVYSFYNAIDVNLLSSHSEGLPYCVLEGGAMAKPLVCTAVSGMLTLIEDNHDGIIVPIGDSEAFSRGMLRLCTDGLLRKNMGIALESKVREQYSHRVMAKRYVDFYKSNQR